MSDSDSETGSCTDSSEEEETRPPAVKEDAPPPSPERAPGKNKEPDLIIVTFELFSGIILAKNMQFLPGTTLKAVRQELQKKMSEKKQQKPGRVVIFFGREQIQGCPSPSTLAEHGFTPGRYTFTTAFDQC